MKKYIVAALVCFAFAGIAALRIALSPIYLLASPSYRIDRKPAPLPEGPPFPPAIHHPKRGRPVLAHSIRSVDELRRAALADLAVAEHYKDFQWEGARVVRLPYSMLAFASFRVENNFYWTVSPRVILAGSWVIQDSAGHTIRMECGNLLSLARGLNTDTAEEIPEVWEEAPLVTPAVYIPPRSAAYVTPIAYTAAPPVGSDFGSGTRGGVPTSGASLPLPNLSLCGIFCFALVKMIRSLRRIQ